VTQEVIDCFYRYRWSGNIREMENVIERAIILGTGDTLTLADLPERIRNADQKAVENVVQVVDGDVLPPLDDAVEALEKDLITRAMQRSNHVVSNAAKLLSIKRTTLIAKMKKLGMKE